MARRNKSRGDGEGSIYQRNDGLWVAQVTFVGADGERKKLTRMAGTQSEARRLLTDLKAKQDAGKLVVSPRNSTIGNWLDTWLESYIKPSRAPRTYVSYHQAVNNYVPDRIRRIPLCKLPELTESFDQLFMHVAAENGGRTAENLRAVLRSAFNTAKKKHRVASNCIADTEPIKYEHCETATFTAEEGLRFLEAAEGDRLGTLFTITLSLGLREGEGTGLRAEDLDFDNRIVHVRRTLQWNKLPGEENGHWDERPCKAKSKRDLPMTETIYRALLRHIAGRQHEAATTKGWIESGYLFTSITGAPLHARNVLEAFHRVCDAAKVPRIRLHDTRHSCGTLLHVQGADPFIIQRVLGHSQLSTTRRYTHVPIEVTKKAVSGLESLFEEARKTRDQKPQDAAPTTKVQ